MDTVELILQLLKSQNKQQKELTQYLGISDSSVAEWKKGKTKSYKKHIDKIAEYFGVTTDYLLGRDNGNIQVYDEDDNIVVIDDETRDIIDSLRTNPEMKILFSVTKKATKEDIRKAVKIIEALRDDSEVT